MKRSLLLAITLGLLFVLAVTVTASAQGTTASDTTKTPPCLGNWVDANHDGVCDNAPRDGTGMRYGQTNGQTNGQGNGQGSTANHRHQMGRGRSAQAGQGPNFVDKNNDGQCDNFVDANGDGVCDNCGAQHHGPQAGRGMGNGAGRGMGMGANR